MDQRAYRWGSDLRGDATCALDTSFRAWCWGINTTVIMGIVRHDFHAKGPPLRYEEVPVPVRMVK